MVIRLADHESTCTDAYNPEAHKNSKGIVVCYGSYGPIQISCEHFKKGDNRKDVSILMRIAYTLYERKGGSFSDWSTCKDIKGCR